MNWLQTGNIVAIPTETVYGLAASIKHPSAIEKIFALKGRPRSNPIIVHVASQKQVDSLVRELPPKADALMKAFWPGPLTLILPASDQVPSVVRAGLPSVGIRMPNHPMTLELIREVGPLVAPSANLSGRPSATRSEHVRNDFGDDFPVIDGGECQSGLESTILIFDQAWKIARLGAITSEEFLPILGYVPKLKSGVACPGSLFKHYCPEAKLTTEDEDVVLGYTDRIYPHAKQFFALGRSTEPREIAFHLYARLRDLDLASIERSQIDITLPKSAEYLAIHERFSRLEIDQAGILSTHESPGN